MSLRSVVIVPFSIAFSCLVSCKSGRDKVPIVPEKNASKKKSSLVVEKSAIESKQQQISASRDSKSNSTKSSSSNLVKSSKPLSKKEIKTVEEKYLDEVKAFKSRVNEHILSYEISRSTNKETSKIESIEEALIYQKQGEGDHEFTTVKVLYGSLLDKFDPNFELNSISIKLLDESGKTIRKIEDPWKTAANDPLVKEVKAKLEKARAKAENIPWQKAQSSIEIAENIERIKKNIRKYKERAEKTREAADSLAAKAKRKDEYWTDPDSKNYSKSKFKFFEDGSSAQYSHKKNVYKNGDIYSEEEYVFFTAKDIKGNPDVKLYARLEKKSSFDEKPKLSFRIHSINKATDEDIDIEKDDPNYSYIKARIEALFTEMSKAAKKDKFEVVKLGKEAVESYKKEVKRRQQAEKDSIFKFSKFADNAERK